MIIQAIKCKKCGDIIYSRSRHDFRWCSCKSCAIDGGFDYTKVCGNPDDIESTVVDLEVTKPRLYHDWNIEADKFGLIKENEK